MSDPTYAHVDPAVAEAANRADWDVHADAYQAEHGRFLGDARFVWGPEGWDEGEVGLLGDVAGRRVLEVGCGAAQCARWLRGQGAEAFGIDLSVRQLQHARRLDDETGVATPVACASALRLPFAAAGFDVVCSAFGALPFLVDVQPALSEMARVLRPGGRMVCSVVHPARWMFPDDPTTQGTTVTRSYFDRTPYVELDTSGAPAYVEAHRTLGDWVAAVTASGLLLTALYEPEWPAGLTEVWGGWGPERGRLVPGTLILACERPH